MSFNVKILIPSSLKVQKKKKKKKKNPRKQGSSTI